MADLTITAASVGLSDVAGASVQVVQVGEAVTQGVPVYRLASDGKYWQTDSNASAATAVAAGIILTSAATDDYAVMALPGSFIDLGATLTVGDTYYVSVNKGLIADAAPVTGGFNTILGMAITASQFEFKPNVSGIATP